MKKIMILLLSLAVLFSFAACDNESNTGVSGGLADSIYSESVVVRVAGEKITAADFEFKGLDTFNNPVSVDGADVVLVDGGNVVDSITLANPQDTTKAGTQTINVKTSWGAIGTVDVTVLPVTKVEVSGTPTVKEYKQVIVPSTGKFADIAKQYRTIDPAGMTVKATYIDENGDTQTKNVEPSLVTFDLTGQDGAGWKTVAPSVAVTVSYAGVPATGTTWNVAVVANRVTSISAEVAENYELIADGSSTLDTTKFVVYGTYENGQRLVLTADTDVKYSTETTYAAAQKNYDAASTIKFNADTTEGQKDVYVKYLGEVAEGGSAYTSAKVEVRRDYLKGINVAVTAFTLADDYNFNDSTVDSNGTGLPTEFTVTAVYAGKTTAVNLTPKTDWTVTPIKAADGLADNQTITLTVSPVDGGKADGLEAVSFQVVVGKEIASASYGVAK